MYLGPNQEHVDLTNHYHGKIPNLKGARICRAHKKIFGFNKRTRLGCPICNISLCNIAMFHSTDVCINDLC